MATIDGTDGSETLSGGSGNESISGFGGDDLIEGMAGNDSLLGGDGNDSVFGGEGNDTIDAGDGNDLVFGEDGADLLTGGAGSDTLYGGAGNDTLFGLLGNDEMFGGAGRDLFVHQGGHGSDTVFGGEDGDDFDTLHGTFHTASVTVTFTGNETGIMLAEADTVTFSGIEEVRTGAGSDTIDASATTGGQVLLSDAGNDLVTGGSGADLLLGGTGNDTLVGGAGNDTLVGGAGNDTLNGGTGIDTADYSAATNGINANLQTGDAQDGQGGVDTLIEIDNLIGSIRADILTGNDNGNLLIGGSGNDQLYGNGGNDTLFGDAGDDIISGGAGTSLIYGGTGNDMMSGGTENDTIFGGDGNDAILGGEGNNLLDGGAGNDQFFGGNGADTFFGGSGTDTVSFIMSSSAVTVSLGGGWATQDSTIKTLAQIEAVRGSDFNDAITGSNVANNLDGQGGDDSLFGLDGNDNLSGGAGNDWLRGGQGADTLFGGSGIDTADYADSGSVMVNLGTGTGSGNFAAGDLLVGIENVTAGIGNDTLIGNSLDNLLDGGSRNDSLSGGDGNDTLIGGAGNDTLVGGEGADSLDGGSGNDNLSGENGNDALFGGAGNDSLFGGEGADTLVGGAGNDTLVGGDGNDTADYADAAGAVDANLATGMTTGSTTRQATIVNPGFENELLAEDEYRWSAPQGWSRVGEVGPWNPTGQREAGVTGQNVANMNGQSTMFQTLVETFNPASTYHLTLRLTDNLGYGDANIATVNLYAGATLIGTQTLNPSEGTWHDISITVPGQDVANGPNLAGQALRIEIVNSSPPRDGWTIFHDINVDDVALTVTTPNTDTLQGMENLDGSSYNDILTGDDGANLLAGQGGDDVILGSGGADTLVGGAGNDTLTGGAGNDRFVFLTGSGADRITDFTLGLPGSPLDQLDVSGLRTLDGNPVTWRDVIVSDDGAGNARLLFPQGESIVLEGISPQALDSTAALVTAGVPCFTPGTAILTPRGEIAVEELRPGDLVCTLDNGPQPLVWIGRRDLVQPAPHLRPVQIRAGVCGNRRDLLVSPQHAMLLPLQGQGRADASLLRARHLADAGVAGVRIAQGKRRVSYIHLLFERHQLVFAEGAATESFFPGTQGMNALDLAARAELLELFPDLSRLPPEMVYGPRARPALRRAEVLRGFAPGRTARMRHSA